MAKHEWTKEERREMVALMAEIAATHRCEHCLIVPTDATYCAGCLVEVTDWLFKAWGNTELQAEITREQIAADGGLY